MHAFLQKQNETISMNGGFTFFKLAFTYIKLCFNTYPLGMLQNRYTTNIAFYHQNGALFIVT
jgi:hypothetical protein